MIGEGLTSTLPASQVYPKAHVLNRFIAKLIDLFIVVAAGEIAPQVGFLSGLAYILIADGFAGGKSIGKRLVGLQTMRLDGRGTVGFRESIIRNLPLGGAQIAYAIPYIGWLVSLAIFAFESFLIIGNEQGRRLGDEVARTQVLDAGQLAVPD
ncbi:MAG: RDD family protein [Nitrospira sp.]|nr:RDD family protein [Nitrospira sp.]MDH5496525.1 RDD family protein [Nitrospira sp.]MDH5726500.1 RDD family protein [Nitrospira sp.]